MKWLVVVFAIAFFALQGIASQTGEDKDESGTEQAPTADDAASGNAGQNVKPESQTRLVELSPSPVQIRSRKDGWDIALVCFTGALVLVGAFQIVYLWHTVQATRDNAKAALLNAEAVINAERPWLVVTVEPNSALGRSGHFFFRVTNRGRTPANLVSGGFAHDFKLNANELAIPPVYEGFLAPNNRFLPSGDYFDVYRTIDDATTGIRPESFIESRPADDGPPTDILFFFGNVVYDDVLGKTRPGYAAHETRWCFAFFRDGLRFVSTGPDRTDEYNRYT
jgi:hypothetical protein